MYSLKKAGQIWGSLLPETLLQWNLTQSKIDQLVFFMQVAQEFILIFIVVDDLEFVSNSPKLMDYLKSRLYATFIVKLFGQLTTIIGWILSHSLNGISISQQHYTKTLLKKHGSQNANSPWAPFLLQEDLTSAQPYDQPLSRYEHARYRLLVGELLYLTVCTRQDIMFAVGALARKVHFPTERHVRLAQRILRYICGTRQYVVFYSRQNIADNPELVAFIDSDWTGDKVHENLRQDMLLR